MNYQEEKALVAKTMGRLYLRGLTTATGGNVSARCGEIMLITPSGKDKSSLTYDDIAQVLKTNALAVVHSHPNFASLFSALDEKINTHLIAETYYLLDEVIKVPYELMGTKELAEKVSTYAKDHVALLLENHGALTTGKTLLSAFDRMEVLEQSAKLTYLSKCFSNTNDISGDRLLAIAAMR